MSRPSKVRVARVYDEPSAHDGLRILVDRVWPRGVSKDRARLDHWYRDVAPSTQLRRWYGHDPHKFDEFTSRYDQELHEPTRAQALAELRQRASGQTVTLLTGTRDPQLSHAALLAQALRGQSLTGRS